MSSLAGKSAVVTGSTSGIGLGILRVLAAEGCAVVMNGLGDAKEIEAARAAIESESGQPVRFHPADMSRPAEIAEMGAFAEKEFGQVDILVNNAGIQFVARVEEFPPEKWDAILAINLSSAFHMIRAVLPGMRERKSGRIINIASAHGISASPFKCAYVAAKHGLLGLAKTVALETAEENITCNAICPGYVLTPLVESQVTDTARTRGIPPGNRPARRDAGAPADKALCVDGRGRRNGRLFVRRLRRRSHRRRAFHRRRVVGALTRGCGWGGLIRCAGRALERSFGAATAVTENTRRELFHPRRRAVSCEAALRILSRWGVMPAWRRRFRIFSFRYREMKIPE